MYNCRYDVAYRAQMAPDGGFPNMPQTLPPDVRGPRPAAPEEPMEFQVPRGATTKNRSFRVKVQCGSGVGKCPFLGI